ncbi:hypothetical protein EII12_10635 [Buchananella hordeovulneris]|uniref:variant leucine-rich repeat-containing protein n=1 Tax=Buchananella hordeovulneris TaxID=52770 RepID=UPI000F60212B|nr:hypothetical protein [Buchananella hordeovulneris]RRD49318.1 hypothetical protein EII12_10635 [Buchananella hordeovulneris]
MTQSELLRLAQDPGTPLHTLQQLAQEYPGLRPAIALNPSTYPALLEWLGALGDPAVNQALAQRSAGAPPGGPYGAPVGPPIDVSENEPRSVLPWLLAFLALAFVAAVVWVLLTFFSGPAPAQSGPDAGAVTAPAAPAPAPEEETPAPAESPVEEVRPAPEGAFDIQSFLAPSGNIGCVFGEDTVKCTIDEHSFVPSQGQCDASSPVEVTINADGKQSVKCVKDLDVTGTTLQYEQSAARGPFACTARETGIECWHTVTGESFTLSREALR